MSDKISLEAVYAPSEDIVAREIEGELIIVPIAAGIGDMEDELFTLNETGRAVWKELDGRKALRAVVKSLSSGFDATPEEIEKDVSGLLEELLKRRMIVEVGNK